MKIAICTTGGDAPGLNAVIRGTTETALRHGFEVVGLERGFSGLMEGGPRPLTRNDVQGIESIGGTLLGGASRGLLGDAGSRASQFARIRERLEAERIDGLVIAGGDGSIKIAEELVREGGPKCVVVPKTIDRDVEGTWTTFGFDSATNVATQALDRLQTTARSHDRIMVLEVMGRDVGWIALYTGIAGGAHMIAIPEIPYDLNVYADHVRKREALGDRFHLMVASEGAQQTEGDTVVSRRTGRYGGVGEQLAEALETATGKEARSVSLGHVIRGGAPTTFDRMLGLRFGATAANALHRGEGGEGGVMVALRPPATITIPLAEVSGRIKHVPTHAHEIMTARALGICFGAPD